MGCTLGEIDEGNENLSDDLQNELNFEVLDQKEEKAEKLGTGGDNGEYDDFFQAEEQNEEQFMAVKPWIGALVAPTVAPQFDPSIPDRSLKLHFVNGFKVEDSRKNMFWGAKPNEIVYCAAALGITMNVNTLHQRFMGDGDKKKAQGHTDDVMSLDVCPQRKLVVTGSLGARPLIIVWNSQSMQVLAKANLGRNTRAVSSIRFSKDGKYFFCSDKHNDSNVNCFSANEAKLVGQNKCGSDPVFDGETGANNVFACATKRGIYFFDFNGKQLGKKRGIFGGHSMTSMVTVTYDADKDCFYSGTGNGAIYEWKGNSCVKAVKVHEGAVKCLHWSNGKLLSSGSRDHLLKVSKDGEILHEITLPSSARSLDYYHNQYLVATSCGKILTVHEESLKPTQIMQGHSTGETWGLAVSPNGIFTTADDNQVLHFNPTTKKVENLGIINEKGGKKQRIGGASTLSMLAPNQQSRAVAVNSLGHVALGVNEGTLTIRTTKDLNMKLFEEKIARQWIQVIKYSPKEDRLAVGSHDNNIYILKVEGDQYTLEGACKAHQSFITNIDWSCDGNYIHTNCGAYEYLFFDVNTRTQLKSGGSMLKDEQWASYSVKLGWWVQGIFPPAKSGNHVNGVHRSHGKDVIATGDNWGLVNLYRNPALKGAKYCGYRGHSSHVVRVLLDEKDEFMYSVGGYDKTMMMWKVI